MTSSDDVLPSWRSGPTRDAVTTFLEAAQSVPVSDRFACFDNDGTLWCERPTYVQFDFLVGELKTKVRN
ncbi:MAG TPA: haloacid dehalogenase-like hydrolase, partial [Nocardioides sp.]|nr:haloacid dehalogenase-like hydrolase [Nocardioides sp.]